MTSIARRAGSAAAWLAAALGTLVALFALAAWIGSSIPRNPEWTEPADGITIFVESNGTHTSIVMPVKTRIFDWRLVFPAAGDIRQDGYLPTHISVGWGDREVFLEVAEWSDLSAATAARLTFQGGDTVLRVVPYVEPQAVAWHRPVRLREWEYARLVNAVTRSLPPIAPGTWRQGVPSYQQDAAHYPALGRWTLTQDCNQWVSDRLADAGMKVGLWTPMAGGVMKWVPPLGDPAPR